LAASLDRCHRARGKGTRFLLGERLFERLDEPLEAVRADLLGSVVNDQQVVA